MGFSRTRLQLNEGLVTRGLSCEVVQLHRGSVTVVQLVGVKLEWNPMTHYRTYFWIVPHTMYLIKRFGRITPV